MSFVPTPSFPQYFVMPLACLLLLAAVLIAEVTKNERHLLDSAMLAGSALTLAVSFPLLMQYVPKALSPSSWTVMKAHEAGLSIARSLSGAGLTGKVATLVPVYAFEGNLEVYPEFATGPFAYRAAPYMSADIRQHFRTTSPEELDRFLTADPPAAILVGFDPELEKALVNFANAHGYREATGIDISDRYGKGVLYLRPAPSKTE